ncbi:uncharacterized protein METZ01_LOCUS145812 [marine metagenome]|uniref:Uncharacterized protein n=1 Tax=marine metagenome TaxID=408172 RepID=A0A381ZUJ7_9ZZZZ
MQHLVFTTLIAAYILTNIGSIAYA